VNRKRIENGSPKNEGIFKLKRDPNSPEQKTYSNESGRSQKRKNRAGNEKDREDQILAKLNGKSEENQDQKEHDSENSRDSSNSSENIKRKPRRF